jgi:hypothetical protein
MDDDIASADWAKGYIAGVLGWQMMEADDFEREYPDMAEWSTGRKENLRRAAKILGFEDRMMAVYRCLTGKG